jgi:hypothetical protein
MRTRTRLIFGTLAAIAVVVILPVTAAILLPDTGAATHYIDLARLRAVAQQHPNFTLDQQLAVRKEIQTELHPQWRNLSPTARLARVSTLIRRLARRAAAGASGATTQANAAFQGNLTGITAPPGDALALQRQPNCSLSLLTGTYTLSFSSPAIQVDATTGNYELTLHNAAGLSTTADVFANGCADTTPGVSSRRGMYLGKTSQNQYLLAGYGYDNQLAQEVLYYGTIDPTAQQVTSLKLDASLPGISGVAAGDLNGDGLADVVAISETTASVSVWLAHADGTLGTPTVYALPGATTEAAVVADVNGDGKADVIVATNAALGSASQEQISVLTGNGDGTLNAPQTFSVATQTGATVPFRIINLIAAKLRGSAEDLVGSNGLVLLNDGHGNFTPGDSAFAPTDATSNYGPNLAAADFNKDGKLDLAVNNGVAITLYPGNGDGTFGTGRSYAATNDVGYLTATDLDGDGNLDLYVGLANGGLFGGDEFGVGQAYGLMGNGDGSFQGAPLAPFMNTGRNVADLNGDNVPDAVGMNADFSFTSYLGDGKGGFAAAATVVTSPISIGGTQYSLQGVDSFAIGDLNGDGIPDLAYIAPILNGVPFGSGGTGVFIALGNGQGGFGAPSFYALAPVASSITGAYTIYPTISNLQLADVNHDGRADLVYHYTYSYQNTSNVASTDVGTAVQLSNGDGTFQARQVLPFYSGPDLLFASSNGISTGIAYTSAVTLITDVNKDGKPDLVLVTQSPTIDQTLSTFTATIQVALGNGDGTFATPVNVGGPNVMAGTSNSVVVADMNGDGIPDIVSLGASTTYDMQVAIALGNGDGTFKAPALTTYTAQYLNSYQGLAVADFNGDGKLDVALTDPYDATGSGISLGNGDGTLQTFAASSQTLPLLAINLQVGGSLSTADFNGDGKPDLLAGNVLLLSQATSSASLIGTTTSLMSSAGSVNTGQSVTLTATVAAASGTTVPGGTVTFMDGSTALGTATLGSGGTATFTTTTLAAGTQSITATYGGSAAFAASTSSAVTVAVAGGPAFTVALSAAAGAVGAGQATTTTVSLTPSGGFAQTVALKCSGLPQGATCSFAPASVSVTGGVATSTLTITAGSAAAMNSSRGPVDPLTPGGVLVAGISLPIALRRRRTQSRRLPRAARGALIMATLALLAGCGGTGGGGSGSPSGGSSGATPAGSYTVVVTATAGSVSQSANFALTVN